MKLSELHNDDIVKINVCRRCGLVEFSERCYPQRASIGANDFVQVPGWTTWFNACKLCPACAKEFKAVCDNFVGEQPSPSIEEQSEGIKS